MADSKPFRPLLAAETPVDLEVLEKLKHYPLLCSTKLDGIRAIVRNGVLVSRTMKPIPSQFAQYHFAMPEFEGFDGELLVPEQTGRTIYHDTYSSVMTHKCTDPLIFKVFDRMEPGNFDTPYISRLEALKEILEYNDDSEFPVELVEQIMAYDLDGILRLEEDALRNGHEGLIMRRPDAPYKQGRSTLNQGFLVKLARWKTGEATIISYEQLEGNENEAIEDALGYTKRSSKKEGKVLKEAVGALVVRDLKTGDEFKIGTGFDMALREEMWRLPQKFFGEIVKYRYKPYGTKDLPRQPSFQGFRDMIDMDTDMIVPSDAS